MLCKDVMLVCEKLKKHCKLLQGLDAQHILMRWHSRVWSKAPPEEKSRCERQSRLHQVMYSQKFEGLKDDILNELLTVHVQEAELGTDLGAVSLALCR